MDILEHLYALYNEYKKQRELADLNLTKIADLIRLNSGLLPDDILVETKPQTSSLPPMADYNREWNWKNKVIYVLNISNQPLTAKDIADKVKELEPSIEKSVDKSVELTASRLYKEGVIAADKDGIKNCYYLPSLFKEESK